MRFAESFRIRGNDVRGFSKGDKVTFLPQVTRGTCFPCTHGMYRICNSLDVQGCHGICSVWPRMSGRIASIASIVTTFRVCPTGSDYKNSYHFSHDPAAQAFRRADQEGIGERASGGSADATSRLRIDFPALGYPTVIRGRTRRTVFDSSKFFRAHKLDVDDSHVFDKIGQ